ncbi:hypothetical protein ACIQ9E_06020 [Streptomyces sp. NPDC094448]|uniref:hypothetical protein n=1 Tax=Streptomyces sp. NPDC094448 TaxID=3366063 RepID=UPI003825E7F1
MAKAFSVTFDIVFPFGADGGTTPARLVPVHEATRRDGFLAVRADGLASTV